MVYCYLCDRAVYIDRRGPCEPQQDHITPESAGGTTTAWTHAWCNQVKGTDAPVVARRTIAAHEVGGSMPKELLALPKRPATPAATLAQMLRRRAR